MGDRYWITGVQLGMLLAYTKDGSMHNEAMELGEEIIDKQFIGKVNSPCEQTGPKIARIVNSQESSAPADNIHSEIENKLGKDYALEEKGVKNGN